MISECSKLAQKQYKTTHDWVGKIIHRELCKKLKFDHVYAQPRICPGERDAQFSGTLRYKRITYFRLDEDTCKIQQTNKKKKKEKKKKKRIREPTE